MTDRSFWAGRKVFITGHTGFMGGWLSTYLLGMDAEVTGFALEAPTTPSFFEATSLGDKLAASVIGDIREPSVLGTAMAAAQPSVVFHLAAQALVRPAYAEPHLTFETNIMGTVNVLEAVRTCSTVQAVVAVTTDKVYRNTGQIWAYRENEELGGREPYSASKAGSEIVLDAYRNAYLGSLKDDDSGVGLAAIRAGNIFGGGDWAADRLVPDAIRGFSKGTPLVLRNPAFTRPWQHVLGPLPGYLTLAERLCAEPSTYSEGWNFGPPPEDGVPVLQLAELMQTAWGDDARVEVEPDTRIFEEQLLNVDSAKAAHCLNWTPKWTLETAITRTVEWYKAFYDGQDVWTMSQAQCTEIMEDDS